ncbi:MAG: PleD family two-component system response regulator [Synechococcus sp.]
MKTILVVDDLQTELELISSYLKSEGYVVYSATNGMQALEQISKQKPDAIVSDWMMPEMGGLELCRHLRRNPETANIPVIAYTVKNRDVDRRWAAKQGIAIYLTKPCTREQIINAVRSVVD